MAGLWADHYGNYYNTADLLQGAYAETGQFALSTANPPRVGGTHLRGSAGGGVCRRTLTAAKTVAGLASRNYVNNLPHLEPAGNPAAGCVLRSWRNGANGVQLTVILGTDGSLVVYNGEPNPHSASGGWASMFLYRSTQCIFPQTYHHIEDRITVNGSTGNYELRVDGRQKINLGGISTDRQGTGDVSQVGWYIFDDNGSGIGVTMDVTDVHAWDDLAGEGPVDFVGNAAVIRRVPNADTADADWTLSTGSSGFPLLTDKSDATYIQAASIGQKSGFLATALPSGTTGIVYQQLNFKGEKTDGADCDVAPGFKSSGLETELAGQAMTMGSNIWRWGIVGTDPDTSGAPWSEASCNASECTLTRTL